MVAMAEIVDDVSADFNRDALLIAARRIPIVYNMRLFGLVIADLTVADSDQRLTSFVGSHGGSGSDYLNIVAALRALGVLADGNRVGLSHPRLTNKREFHWIVRAVRELFGAFCDTSPMEQFSNWFASPRSLAEARDGLIKKGGLEEMEATRAAELLATLNIEYALRKDAEDARDRHTKSAVNVVMWIVVIAAVLLLGWCGSLAGGRSADCDFTSHGEVCSPG